MTRQRFLQITFAAVIALCAIILGCARGPITITPVLQGQPSPHTGYLITPDNFIAEGQPAPNDGIVLGLTLENQVKVRQLQQKQ